MHKNSRTPVMNPRSGLLASILLSAAGCGGGASAPVGTGGTPGVGGGTGGDAGGAAPTSSGGTSGQSGPGSGGTPEPGAVGGSGGATSAGGAGEAGGVTTGGGKGGTGGLTGTGGATASGGALGSGGTAGSAGNLGSGGTSVGDGPCDILEAAGLTCVAAHSPVRRLYSKYNGPLYQVCKGSHVAGPNSCTSGMTKDVGIVAGGTADAAAQNAFCASDTCTISILYDQTESGNDLTPGPAGSYRPMPDNPVNASDLKVSLNGHSVYGLKINGGMGYRKQHAQKTALGDDPETIYEVTSANNLNGLCCYDYGSAEATGQGAGAGTMEAIYFGGGASWGTGTPGGHKNGPWVMADLELGLFAGWENGQDQNISTNSPLKFDFVTAMLVGDVATKNNGKGRFALYGCDATSIVLKTMYDGIRPEKPGYVPMSKQAGIVLGIGGDNSNTNSGLWYEGVMANGAATKAVLDELQANIYAAGYGK